MCLFNCPAITALQLTPPLQSPRSGVSEADPESPGDSGTDLRHDTPPEQDHSGDEHDAAKMPTIGVRSDLLLPSHPVPKEGLDLGHLHGLPALEALRRQAGNPAFLAGLPNSPLLPAFAHSRPSQPPTPASNASSSETPGGGSGSWTFEEQFKQVRPPPLPSLPPGAGGRENDCAGFTKYE
jgi:hypothetical protein